MEMSSFVRAVTGRLGRVAVRGVGMRITIGGVRLRLSARAFSRIHFWEDEKMMLIQTERVLGAVS